MRLIRTRLSAAILMSTGLGLAGCDSASRADSPFLQLPTATPSPSASPVPSPSASPSPMPTPTVTPSAAPTTTPTPSVSATATPTATPTPSASPTATPTATPTPTTAPTATPTVTPSASPTPTAAPGTADARACVNPALLTVGNRFRQVVRTTDGGSGTPLTTTSETLVTRETLYRGNTAIETDSTVEARSATNPAINSDSRTRSYQVLVEGREERVFGLITEATASGFATTVEVQFTPPMIERFDLAVGESFTQTYTVTTTTQTPFGSFPVDTQVTRSTRYVGRESVTVPAGTFEACRFDITEGDRQDRRWVAVGSGLVVRQIAGDDETVLLEASINGQPIP